MGEADPVALSPFLLTGLALGDQTVGAMIAENIFKRRPWRG